MKLTIFIGGLSGGGSERVTCNLANYLCGNGHYVEIVTMSDDKASYPLASSVSRISLLSQGERKNFIYNIYLRWYRLRRYIRTSDTQCYLVMLPYTIVFLLALHRYIQVPVIVSERADPTRISRWLWWILRYLVRYADGFVFQTVDAKEHYVPYIQGKPAEIIANAINPVFIRPVTWINRQKQILAIGRLTSQKNFMLLLRAFAAIHIDYPEYTLTIYGQGEQRGELENFIKQHQLKTAVFLPGYVKDIPQQLLSAEVFVLSSDFEGMPNALMEAMASGLACVATDCPCGGPRFLIQNGTNGFLIPVGNQMALETALRRVLTDTSVRETVGKNAIQIQQTLAPEIIYKKWEEFLERFVHEL